MSNWNFANVWETIAETIPDAPALAHGDRCVSWRQFDERADGIAAALVGAGLGRAATVAQYLRNRPEYLESVFACFKASLTPVNTNFRYGADELTYLWGNAEVGAVVFQGEFADLCSEVRHTMPHVRLWLWVDDGTGPCPSWASAYEDAASTGVRRVGASGGRSGSDLYLLYTGGTTGMPKGVMWRQDDLVALLLAGARRAYPEHGGLDDVRATVDGAGPVHLPACPLMHATGSMTSMGALIQGGCVVTLTSPSLDAVELLDAIERERVQTVAIVGDAFSRPIVEALDAHPGRWNLSSLDYVLSAGVIWSDEYKSAMLRHRPTLTLVDTFGSSEAVGVGRSVTRHGTTTEPARFRVDGRVRVIGDDGRPVTPGSGEIGRVAVAGRGPLGYLKDEERSERTFPVIDGVRYSVPGDYAAVDADGSIVLLGRGSAVVNTGGEKVFPEEVEEALKEHPAVLDAAVVGVPDERFGEAVTALVEPRLGAEVSEDALIDHVKRRLASYKAPKRVVIGSVGRSATGKLDYPAVKARLET